nr:hypothetical protein [Tissierella carlieri]
MYAQRLQTPENYSIPVPGYNDNTTKIVNLTFPSNSGATKWMVKVGDEAFGPFKLNEVISDGRVYNSGTDIEVSVDKYLLLAAVDANARIKAYASIKITDEMVRAPKVEAEKDGSITSDMALAPGEKYSGATKVSRLAEGLKLAVLDTEPAIIYETDKFNSVVYTEGIELIVANDEEVDNMTDEFKKYIVVYSEKDGKIEKYNIVEVTSANVSGAFKAKELAAKTHYSLPVKGNAAGTTKIETLSGLKEFDATKWMYIAGNELTPPKLDRVVKDSKDYVADEDIKIGIGQDLMLLATDNNGRVRACGIVKEITGEMIKNPLAEELKETTHYTKPVKGFELGATKFGFLKYGSITDWKYVVSDEVISAPELNSPVVGGSELKLTNDSIDNLMIESDLPKLKDEKGFKKYMMVCGLDSIGNVKVFKSFVMNDTNVRMPKADDLVLDKHYSAPIKGNSPNTTRIVNLTHTGLSSTGFRYKLIDKPDIEIEFNQVIDGIHELRPNVDIPTTIGKNLLILAVDGSNKTKAHTIVPLNFNNVKAGNAPLLQPTTNYQGPVPGNKNESTRFTFLSLPSGAKKWVYKVGNTSFGVPETGTDIKGDGDYKEYTFNEDIEGVSVNKYLLLVAVDEHNKVIAYREFRLNENQIKGKSADKLNSQAYYLMEGDNPSTTKLKLEPLGLENPSSIVWRYKLVNNEPVEEKEKPYLNQIISDTKTYSVNSSTKIGPDIAVTKVDGSYGYMLLLATDNSGRTKAYEYIPITADDVKKHADEISGANISEGSVIDSVKIIGLDTNKEYKYLISNTSPATPAIGDTLPSGAKDYDFKDIVVQIGRYLTIYNIEHNKIVGFKTFQIDSVTQGKAELSGDTFLEGSIKNGGSSFTITLTGATWTDVANDKSIRDKLFNGFKADSEATEWSKVVASMIADGKGAISKVNDTTITILLPQTLNYDIKEDQKISLVIPPEDIVGAINPITATGTITIKPTIGATISGDVVSSIVRQADIKAGGKTIIVELADGTWANLANTKKEVLVDGFSSSGGKWADIAKKIKTDGNIVRNSGTKVTITLPSVDVDFGTTLEVITLTIPESSGLIDSATKDVIASPSFTLYPDTLTVTGKTVDGKDKVTLTAPDYRVVDTNNDTWQIKVTTGTLKDNTGNNDVIISGLPRGLVANVSKVVNDTNDTAIQIKVSGTASATLPNETIVKVKVKGTAVTEPNSVDSDEIELKLVRGESMMGELEKVGIDVFGGELKDGIQDLNSDKIEFSLNSTNGSNGDWTDAIIDNTKNIEFKPGKVYVREKANPKVFREVANLTQPKAPVGIVVSEVDYSDGLKVKLSGFDAGVNYDISTNGGKEWKKTFVISEEIILLPESDLRVRYRATENSLPSLATGKLNGLDLRNVKMDVGAGLLKETNTSMQYSLDSTDGIDGKWAAAKAGETPISLIAGNTVWIRQQTSKVNIRSLGNVTAMLEPDIGTIDNPKITYNIASGEIKNNTDQDLECKLGGSTSWLVLAPHSIIKDVRFAPGPLEIRTRGSDTILPSKSKVLASIPNPTDPPELKGDDNAKTISYLDESSLWKLLDDNFQYRIGANSNDWKDGSSFNISEDETAVVYVRKKATDKLLPSNEKAVSFTKNLTFENIIFDIVGKAILGTTTKMEYSINSKNEKSGIWIPALDKKTPIEPFEGMYIWLREVNKPSTEKLYVENLSRQVVPDLIYVYYNVETNKISNQSSYNLKYRIADGEWKDIDAKTDLYGIEFKPGKLEFKERATDKKMESHPAVKAVIGSPISGPSVEIDDVENKILSITSPVTDRSKIEYRVNPSSNSPWISGELLDTEDLSGDKIVQIRIKATPTTLASQVTEVKFTKNLELEHVKLSTHVNPHQLNGTTAQMEYNIYLNDGRETSWKNCSEGNTQMPDWLPESIKIGSFIRIEIRDSKQHGNAITVYPKP